MIPLVVLLLAFPLVAPLPATCADPCTVESTSNAYLPPVAAIASGSSVVFSSGDIGHVTVEGVALGETCFVAVASPESPPPPVTFRIVEGALRASYTDKGGAYHDAACASAVALPGGAFALPYTCRIHSTMHGVLVVTP